MLMPAIRILLVEDEEAIRELLLEVLVDGGFEVVETDTGDRAFGLLESNNPHLLLTDINLPGRLDGIELAKRARAGRPGMPVIFITGKPDGAIRARKIDKPSAILAKPFNFAEVVETVRRLAGTASAQKV
jgi:DNA-binding response OmpR family regulator